MTTNTPPQLVNAFVVLWRPHPDEHSFDSAFAQLRSICEHLYPASGSGDRLTWALHCAMRSFGLPHRLPHSHKHLALSAEEAAAQLHIAFCSSRCEHIHLCPLDCADDLPNLAFGSATIRRFTPSELEDLVNIPRLRRMNPTWAIDSTKLAEFTWMVVREEVMLATSAEERALPFLYEFVSRDIGSIVPHERRFPAVVEDALFSLLLCPWEEWGNYTSVEWRAFSLPWIYTVNSDVFVHQNTPPSSASLSWEPCSYTDRKGNLIEDERPSTYVMSDRVLDASGFLNDTNSRNVSIAKSSCLFGAPVAHFLVRGFLSSGIDEFLAHVSAIEAGIGAKVD